MKELLELCGYSRSNSITIKNRGHLTYPMMVAFEKCGIKYDDYKPTEEHEDKDNDNSENAQLYKSVYAAVYAAMDSYSNKLGDLMYEAFKRALKE